MATDLIIKNAWALGDTVCLSALVRDLHLAHPGQYRLHMAGNYQSYWRHCPYAQPLTREVGARVWRPHYVEGIRAAGRGSKKHFLSWFHEDFKRQMGVKVPVTRAGGEIFLPPEKNSRPAHLPARYWVVVAGCKADMTTKQWDVASWQSVVDMLAARGVPCVQAGADFNRHHHPRLYNVVQAVGSTDDIQDFFRLIKFADGVLCGITAAMHAAAALDRPCVVIAGGREDPSWEKYGNEYLPESFGPVCSPVRVPHKFLHTVGLLDCCEKKGCWKDKVVPISREDLTDPRRRETMCKRRVELKHQKLPECMTMITPTYVVDAALSYYEEGILPWF